jgi:hypothetical protein
MSAAYFKNSFSVALVIKHQIRVKVRVNDKLETVWEPTWPILRYHPRTCLEEIRNPMKNLSQQVVSGPLSSSYSAKNIIFRLLY